jgi:hypothetical protein
MILLLLISIISISLLFLIANCLRKNNKDEHSKIILKNLSILELAMGALSMMLGLFLLFELIEVSTLEDFSTHTPELILITTAIVFGILHLALFIVLTVKRLSKSPY